MVRKFKRSSPFVIFCCLVGKESQGKYYVWKADFDRESSAKPRDKSHFLYHFQYTDSPHQPNKPQRYICNFSTLKLRSRIHGSRKRQPLKPSNTGYDTAMATGMDDDVFLIPELLRCWAIELNES